MSYEMEYSCDLRGDEFDPTPFLNIDGIKVLRATYVGDILDIGRYIGKPSPYGSLEFTSVNDDFDAFVLWLYEKVKDLLDPIDPKDKMIYVTICYSQQCNMEFDPDTLSRIGAMGLCLAISCYEDEEDENV